MTAADDFSNMIVTRIAKVVHDEALRHPGVNWDTCQNAHCKAQAFRVAELVLAEVKKIK